MPRRSILKSPAFKRVYHRLQIPTIDAIIHEEADFGTCEEILYLNKSLSETEKIQNELLSTINYLKKLSTKYGSLDENYLCNFTPGNIWSQLACSGVLINERRSKHDLNSPQQHHKVQEINDGSYVSSTASNISIINHLTEVNKGSEFNADEGVSDHGKSFHRLTESKHQIDYVLPSPNFDFIRRHRFRVELIKIKREIHSVILEIQKTESKSSTQVHRCNNYLFKCESTKMHTPTKCSKFFRRNITTSLCTYKSPRPNLRAKPSSALDFITPQPKRILSEI